MLKIDNSVNTAPRSGNAPEENEQKRKTWFNADFFKVRWLLVLYDFILFAIMGVCMTFLYQRCIKTPSSHKQFLLTLLVIYGVLFIVRFLFTIYRQVWRYGGVESYIRLYISDTVAGVLFYLGERLLMRTHVSFIWLLSVFCVNLLLSLFTRIMYRYLYKSYNLNTRGGRFKYLVLRLMTLDKIKADNAEQAMGSLKKINIAIIGAGNTGVALAGELKNLSDSPYYPVLFVDISAEKTGRIISGIPVISEKDATPARIAEYEVQEIVFALPHLSENELTELYTRYSAYGVKIKAYDYPLMRDAANSRRTVRELDVEELLFRRQSLLLDEAAAAYYKGKTVLITGGGGSIGSELCRQLAQMESGHIIVLDVYENGAYDIQQELQMKYGSALKVSVEIASVCNRADLERVFAKYRPQIVLHAAAHKHVPLMENNCVEAVNNNVFGTLNTVELSEKFGVDRFIMISTDKAVNPTNVMGATKRMCEEIVLTHGRKNGHTQFSATRFGNVLGSNGSVIPLFHRQIANGGPVTITDKRIIRYFMTIPEASQLVLCSGVNARNGELFVLDMGKPVKIIDLAVNMIRLNGLTPGKDIEETGLRPGEKLFEELLVKNESLRKTDNEKIFIETDTPISEAQLAEKLEILRKAVETGDDAVVKAALKQTVETFHDPETVNEAAQRSEEMRDAMRNTGK